MLADYNTFSQYYDRTPSYTEMYTWMGVDRIDIHCVGLYGLCQINNGIVVEVQGEPTDVYFYLRAFIGKFAVRFITNGDTFNVVTDDQLALMKNVELPPVLKTIVKELVQKWDFIPLMWQGCGIVESTKEAIDAMQWILRKDITPIDTNPYYQDQPIWWDNGTGNNPLFPPQWGDQTDTPTWNLIGGTSSTAINTNNKMKKYTISSTSNFNSISSINYKR